MPLLAKDLRVAPRVSRETIDAVQALVGLSSKELRDVTVEIRSADSIVELEFDETGQIVRVEPKSTV